MVKVKKRYIRIILGFLLPLMIMDVLLAVELCFLGQPLIKLLFFLLYAPFVLFIPLLLYSYLMDLIVIPRCHKSTWCICFISVLYALFVLFIPFFASVQTWESLDFKSYLIMAWTIITGLTSGYILQKIHP